MFPPDRPHISPTRPFSDADETQQELKLIDPKIERLYGRYESDRAPMYLALGDKMAERSIMLGHRGEFVRANVAADKAREYREAAWLLSVKPSVLR